MNEMCLTISMQVMIVVLCASCLLLFLGKLWNPDQKNGFRGEHFYGFFIYIFFKLTCFMLDQICFHISVASPKRTSNFGFRLLYIPVDSYGHVETVSSPSHTFTWVSFTMQFTSILCTYFH